MTQLTSPRIAIAGGGIAGLTAAAYLARGGADVTVFERARAPGGRARSDTRDGYTFNLGPHALYAAGAAAAALRELGVDVSGGKPPASGYALRADRAHALPFGAASLLTSGALRLGGKLELARLMMRVARIDTEELAGTSVAAWLDGFRRDTAAVIAALVRVATYAADHERLDAGAAVRNLQLAAEASVLYLDGGWQSLVDGLRDAALAAGARIETGARVESVRADRVVLAGDRTIDVDAAVIAAAPAVVARVAPTPSTAAWAEQAMPVRAACLDVALSELPAPRARFALGLDDATYFSVHSGVADVAPDGGAVIHLARYLRGDEASTDGDRAALEAILDRLQSGWRERVVHARFLPAMNVTEDMPRAARGGLRGRPGPEIPELPGVYVAGDWVGAEGMLADAAAASARAVAEEILSRAGASSRTAAGSGDTPRRTQRDDPDPARAAAAWS